MQAETSNYNTLAPRWYDEHDQEDDPDSFSQRRADALISVCNTLEKQNAARRERWRKCVGLYEGRQVSLEDDQYYPEIPQSLQLPPMFNLVRSACDTAQADVAGRQRPKPMFMTTGSDWKTRRKAKKLDKFVEAQLQQRQGTYIDAWQVMLRAFLDSCIGGTGLVKVFACGKKVSIERVLPWEILIDERAARYNNPTDLFHVYDMERDKVLDLFGRTGDPQRDEAVKLAVMSAKPSRATTTRICDAIRVREGWHLPIDSDDSDYPGRHSIAIENCELFTEPWIRPRFPFVRVTWNHQFIGYWGVGLAETGETMQVTYNDSAERLADRIKICATLRTYYNPDAVKKELLEDGGDSELLIPVGDMSQVPVTPPPQPASAAEFNWLKELKQNFYESLGVSQMTANAQKPPGVNAAVAMETLNDISTVRFLPKARGYETSFEDLGQLIVDAAHDVAEEHGGYLVRWPGKRFLQELDFKEVNLDEDMYQIRVAPVSQFSRDPSSILELASELRQSGDITRETYLQMIGLPDFEGMLDQETAETEWVRELMDRYLDATDESELAELGGFEAPEPFTTNIAGLAALCVSIYWEAKRDRAPEFCLNNIRKFISMLKASSDQQQAQTAAANQAAAGSMLAPGAQIQAMRQGGALVGDMGQQGAPPMSPMGQA